jgi:hypothetical protein
MPKRALLPLALLFVPATAFADDDSPAPEEAPIEAPSEAPIEQPPIAAPAAVAPIAAPAPAADPCSAFRHGHWRSHHRGHLSIGFSKGHIQNEDDTEGSQRSLVARFNGRRGWSLELELSKLSFDGGATAKTGGASIVHAFGKHKIAPYLLAGVGGGHYEHANGDDQRLHFMEGGGGLILRKAHFSIAADVRHGVRRFEGDAMNVARTTTPASTDDRERYVRGRIVALINF